MGKNVSSYQIALVPDRENWKQKQHKPARYSSYITQHFFPFLPQAKAIFKEVFDTKPNLINLDFL